MGVWPARVVLVCVGSVGKAERQHTALCQVLPELHRVRKSPWGGWGLWGLTALPAQQPVAKLSAYYHLSEPLHLTQASVSNSLPAPKYEVQYRGQLHFCVLQLFSL